jgi:hypothetical protein
MLNLIPIYFIFPQLKNEFLASAKSRLGPSGNTLSMDNLILQFYGKGMAPTEPSSSLLPVMLYSCPPHFNTLEYFDVSGTHVRSTHYVTILCVAYRT